MTTNMQEHAVVAPYDSHAGAEFAVRALEQNGIDLKRLSIVAKADHTEEHVAGFYTVGDRIMVWGGRGAFWGSLWRMLLGGAFLFIPGVGSLVVMGPLSADVVVAIEDAAEGCVTGALAVAFAGMGIPEDSVAKYELDVKVGRVLLIVRGSDGMILHARSVLGTTQAVAITAHSLRPAPVAKEAQRAQNPMRDSILKLLSSEQNDRVAPAEVAPRLTEGDEYLDLEKLERGVQRARGPILVRGRVLPRKALQAETWGKILGELSKGSFATERMDA